MTLADEINRMIRKVVDGMLITSSGGDSPKTNRVIDTGDEENPDLESMIKDGSEDTESSKEQKQVNETIKKVQGFDKGQVGEIQRLTSEQFANLKGFVENPAAFLITNVFKKFAKGVGVIALVALIFEAVKAILDVLTSPGRPLDIRFRRSIKDEIISFRKREDQQSLKQGFSSIIITTTSSLRGGQHQTVYSLDLVRRDNFPDNIGQPTFALEPAGMDLSKSKGFGRRQYRR